MANVTKIKLPNGNEYTIKDTGALPLTGGSVTGPVSFGDSVSIDEATIGDLVVNGSASFTNNINANTINSVAVGSSPKFTDTITTVTTTGSGNAITAITASNGAVTATKGATFLTSFTETDPTVPSWAKQSTKPSYTASSATTGITIADHSSTTIYGVSSSTTSVTGVQSSTTTASKVTLGTAISVPNVTAAGSGSFTQGSFSGGSLTMSIDSTDTKKLNITFTAATHGADSHTHTPPTLGTAKSIPNVTGVSDVTVPIKNTSATTVPIKNSSTTTVITSKTHSVTDNGHTHSLV